jgi:hypothetical protein
MRLPVRPFVVEIKRKRSLAHKLTSPAPLESRSKVITPQLMLDRRVALSSGGSASASAKGAS